MKAIRALVGDTWYYLCYDGISPFMYPRLTVAYIFDEDSGDAADVVLRALQKEPEFDKYKLEIETMLPTGRRLG